MADLDFRQIDVEDFLAKLVDPATVRVKGDEVFYSCPFPGHSHGDKNQSASMKIGSTVCHCFGCGFSGNAVTFLAELEGVSPIEAKKWLRKEYFGGYNVPDGPFVEHIRGIVQTSDEPLAREWRPPSADFHKDTLVFWDAVEQNRERAGTDLGYMIDRGFTTDTLVAFDIGYDDISGRITIPVFMGSQLIGYKARTPRLDEQPRYKVLGDSKGSNVYGFDPYETSAYVYLLEHAAAGPGPHFLCEGELNALAMQQMGFDACGISGKFVSPTQARLLVKYFDSLTLIFDEEKDAIEAARMIDNRIPTYIVPKRDVDPADLLLTEGSFGQDLVSAWFRAAKPAQLATLPA